MARLGKMIAKEIESSFLNETLTVKVYLPKEFNSLYQHQVCYMQDGDDYFQMGRVATISDRLHDEDVLVNTSFVGIHYINRQDRLKKYHPEGAAFEAYQQFLTKEVMPLVDDLLPLNPLGKTQTIMGDSLAGTFALVTALAYPNLFHNVIMQSPLVDESVLSIVQQSTNAHRLSFYHSIGLAETAVWTTLKEKVDFIGPNEELATMLSGLQTSYLYEKIADGNHTWKYWQQELPDVLERMLS